MAKKVRFIFSSKVHSPFGLGRLFVLGAAPLFALSAPAYGQDVSSSASEAAQELEKRFAGGPVCAVFSAPSSRPDAGESPKTYGRLAEAQTFDDGPMQVVVSCDGHGLSLGRADSYRSKINEKLQTVSVVTTLGTQKRVWLVSRRDGQAPLLEELTDSLARSAGRSPVFGLEDIEVDLAGFEEDGAIAVRPSGGGRPAKAGQLKVGEQLARAPDQAGGSGDSERADR